MAVINRALYGYYQDGVTVGLRCSLSPNDALSGDSSVPGRFSFDSEWTDIAGIAQVNLTARQTAISVPPHAGVTIDGFKVSWSGLGYKPFLETRLYRSGVIYDDYFPDGPIAGVRAGCRGYIVDAEVNNMYIQGGVSGDQMLSIIYKIPIPSG